MIDPQAIPALIFQTLLFAAFLFLDPLVIHKPVDSKPTIANTQAHTVKIDSYGDSILLHLPKRS